MKLRRLSCWLLLAGFSSTASAEVLEFWSAQCPPCRLLAPTIVQLQQAGYAVRPVDVAREPALASRYRVTHVPTLIVVENGQEKGRLVGARPYAELVAWFRRMGVPTRSAAPTVRPQSPDSAPALTASQPPTAQPATEPAATTPAAAPRPMAPQPAATRPPVSQTGTTVPQPGGVPSSLDSLMRQAAAATVRLRVEDATGYSYGSGTVVDRRGDQLLILTCGHIFRESQGRGAILVDLFHPQARQPIPAQLLAYEADKADIGLVAIRTSIPVEPMRVAGRGQRLTVGMPVFSAGCDRGNVPSIQRTRITAVDRYTHSPNVEIEGEPVDGRSGGGLFTQEGLLIAVCNAADHQERRGLYASLPLIQGKLDQLGLAHVYRGNSPADDRTGSPVANVAASGRSVPAGAASAPPVPTPTPTSAAAVRRNADEVICVVRTRDGKRRVLVIPAPSQELMSRLERASAGSAPNRPNDVTTASAPSIPSIPPRRTAQAEPLVRTQSPY